MNVPSTSDVLPEVKIIEQPVSKNVRFRYKCEGRFNTSIPGASGKGSFPTIRVLNYNGPLSVIVSCVTSTSPHYPHPHKLANGNDVQEHGSCYFYIPSNNKDIEFKHLSIQCVARRHLEESLTERERARIDPFNTGFSQKLNPKSYDLTSLRLCFQVFLETPNKTIPLEPVVSVIVYNKKVGKDLKICWLSHHSASMSGGTRMCILCEKVSKSDIQVKFFTEDNKWEATAILREPKVFKQVAIVFETPAYRTIDRKSENLREPLDVFIQLRRISDGETSDPQPFMLLPQIYDNEDGYVDHNSLKRKRDKYSQGIGGEISRRLQEQVLMNPSLINVNRIETLKTIIPDQVESAVGTSYVKTEPWELPPATSALKHEPWKLLPLNNQLESQSLQMNNSMNILSKPTVTSGSLHEYRPHHYNIPPIQVNQPQEQTPSNYSDILNTDSWIKDLLDIVNQDQESSALANVPMDANTIVPEPEIKFVTPVPSTSNFIGNTQNIDNAFILNDLQPTNHLIDLQEYNFDNTSKNNHTISDIIKELTSGAPDTNMKTVEDLNIVNEDSMRFSRDSIQDFINSLNDLYKMSNNNNNNNNNINLTNVQNIYANNSIV